MASNKIHFEHPTTGEIRQAPVGFSWTMLFFGFFPPLFRGDWKWAIITLLIGFISCGLSFLVFIFIYNKLYIKDLINKGFKARTVDKGDIKAVETKLGINIPKTSN